MRAFWTPVKMLFVSDQNQNCLEIWAIQC